MKTHLTDIARHELEMLLRDAKEAVNGLERQRKSAKQALDAAQDMQRCRFDFSNEEQMRLVRLLDTVCHLENVLDNTLDEIEQIEGGLFSPEAGQLIVWPLPVNSVADNDCP
jgi:ABC-type transporter Mla subunit MlaD